MKRQHHILFLKFQAVSRLTSVAMDVEERLSQVAVSQLSKNKKLQQVLEHRSAFEDAVRREEDEIPAERSFHETDRGPIQ